MGKTWDGGGIAYNAELWREVYRVLKPGAHLLAFGGTRTSHRMVCAIEDAGFEIRDSIAWVYGGGFPKSLNVSKALDKAAGAEREVVGYGDVKRASSIQPFSQGRSGAQDTRAITVPATEAARQWDGWGTALKPAYENICVARKPFPGNVAANVLKWGTGAMNIGACVIPTEENLGGGAYAQTGNREDLPGAARSEKAAGMMAAGKTVGKPFEQPTGRYPANLILDGSPCVLAGFPETKSGKLTAQQQVNGGFKGAKNCYGDAERGGTGEYEASSGSAARFFKCCPQDTVESTEVSSQGRFRYQAKASRSERNKGCEDLYWHRTKEKTVQVSKEQWEQLPEKERAQGNIHATVKPLALMRYLVKLVTPPGGTVLDPFMGSGTTGIAAREGGFEFVGIELETSSWVTATKRIGATDV